MTPMFSPRLPKELTPNRLAVIERAMRSSGQRLLDVTLSNPTTVGLVYPEDLLSAVATSVACAYDPDPQGLVSARAAVSAGYASRNMSIDVEDLVLTASTSEAYSLLFKLLCAPGEAVLTPSPSYPLLDHLAALDGVVATTFPIEYHGRWAIDLDMLHRSVSSVTRAIVLVQPNNPTGSFASQSEIDALVDICGRWSIPLIVDEVFSGYSLLDAPDVLPVVESADVPIVRLGGLSKSIGLPQAKLAWIALQGPAGWRHEALARMLVINDMYLSVSTAVQLAAPALLAAGGAVRSQIQDRILENHRLLQRVVDRHPACRRLRAEAGWSGVIRVPSIHSEEDLAVDLLEHDHVLVHPGYFFDFPHEAFVIVSLLVPADDLRDGLECVLTRAESL